MTKAKKIRQVAYIKNLVKTNWVWDTATMGHLELPDHTKASYAFGEFTIATLQKLLCASRNFIYTDVQPDLHYIYINRNNPLISWGGAEQIYFKTDDVVNFFTDHFTAYQKTRRINPATVFNKKDYISVSPLIKFLQKPNLNEDKAKEARTDLLSYAIDNTARTLLKHTTLFKKINFDQVSKLPDVKINFTINLYDASQLTNDVLERNPRVYRVPKYYDSDQHALPVFATASSVKQYFKHQATFNRYYLQHGAVRFKYDNGNKVLWYLPPHLPAHGIGFEAIEDALLIPMKDYTRIVKNVTNSALAPISPAENKRL